MKRTVRNSILITVGVGVLVVLGFGYSALGIPALHPIDENNAPKFVQHDFIDLAAITSISKFRSGEGHDFSDKVETCRSMKHYFTPQRTVADEVTLANDTTTYQGNVVPPPPNPATAISIYSPVDGRITQLSSEQFPVGKQVYIRPDKEQAYTFRIFHVTPADGIHVGSHVTAGEKIGEISRLSDTDISVELATLRGTQLLSYFQVMPDSIFAAYQARGATSRNDFVISKEYRDSHPLQCNGESFVQQGSSPTDDFHLSGWVDVQSQQGGPGKKR